MKFCISPSKHCVSAPSHGACLLIIVLVSIIINYHNSSLTPFLQLSSTIDGVLEEEPPFDLLALSDDEEDDVWSKIASESHAVSLRRRFSLRYFTTFVDALFDIMTVRITFRWLILSESGRD